MFLLSLKLMRILHEILETVYSNSKSRLADTPGSRDGELLRQSLELNDQLDQLLTFMPERLSSFVALPQSANCSRACELSLHEQALITRLVPTIFSRSWPHCCFILQTRNLLTIPRFLYARIMLLRPLTLIIGNRSSFSSLSLGFTVFRECCSLCLASAELLVLSLHPSERTSRRLADWHTIYRIYTLQALASV